MSQNRPQLEPLDLGVFVRNRETFPLDELTKYAGNYIAYSADGRKIVAHGKTEEALEEMLQALGIHSSQVVHSYVDPL